MPSPHEIVQKIIENDFYISRVKKFTNETFITLITDRIKALELAKKLLRNLSLKISILSISS